MFKSKNGHLLKAIILALSAIGCFYVSFAFAQGEGLGAMAEAVTGSLATFAKLVTGLGYLAGLIFAVLAVLKFKAHRDNPAQVPISTPIVLMFVAVGLLFLPGLFGKAAESLGLRGEAGKIAGISELEE
jgi:intracellular multiplication protein IcmD